MTATRPLERFLEARARTLQLVGPLAVEDFVAASDPDASPIKWHLGHTTWFVERYFLERSGFRWPRPRPEYDDLFDPGRRALHRDRGIWTRPTVAEVLDYRRAVEEAVSDAARRGLDPGAEAALELSTRHEALHQELLLTELQHLLWKNPLRPAYREWSGALRPSRDPAPLRFIPFPGGEIGIGHHGPGFSFANETPRHRRLVAPFQLANRLVTNREFLEFMTEGGYRTRSLWLADGWEAREAHGWKAPLYWEREADDWTAFTLEGRRRLDPAAPVGYVSWFEADAFARWRGCRLPLETEWEVAAGPADPAGANLLEAGRLVPLPAPAKQAAPGRRAPAQLLGDLWEWTGSAHLPYPGYRPEARLPGDPTTRFLTTGPVARGGSCLTPALLARATTRHPVPPADRRHATGIRLARDPIGPLPAPTGRTGVGRSGGRDGRI